MAQESSGASSVAPQGFIVSESDPEKWGRVPVGRSIIIGRTINCGYPIEDSGASREHLEIVSSEGSFSFRDLGSTNGTLVNGKPAQTGVLEDGDQIRIGETVLVFELHDVAPEGQDSGETLFRANLLADEGKPAAQAGTGDADTLLHAVYSVMNDIATNFEPCSLVDHILETSMRAIDAQRGAIFFGKRDSEELEPCPVCDHVHIIQDGKIAHTDARDIRISGTVARRVLEGGESVHFRDTVADEELNAAESVLAMDLRSIICVPLRGKYGVLGILYIDSDRPNQQYSHEHMLLATAVGNSAGLALENAEMHLAILDKQRIDQEIEFAGDIQEGFLTKEWPDDDPRFRVYGDARPARTVGGDFYDFVQPTPDKVGVLIGDVSGKGVPAALAMAQLLAEFRVYATQERSPASILEALNVSLARRSQRGMFCTLCYFTLDLPTGALCCANAGHHPPLRIAEKGVSEFANPSGPPVGVLPEAAYSDDAFTLEPGETVLLYTDGILEARGGDAVPDTAAPRELDEYGIRRLRELLRQLCAETPERVVEGVLHAVHRFCDPGIPHDDCTLIALRYQQ